MFEKTLESPLDCKEIQPVRSKEDQPWVWTELKGILYRTFSSVQFSPSVMSDSLQPHESQHTRPPCPSPSPGVHSDSRPSSRWCHPAISSSVVPFSSCPQSLPASESFPMSQLFAWDGQSTGFNLSIIPSKEHSGLISFRMDWLDLLAVQGTLKSLLQHHSSKASILQRSCGSTGKESAHDAGDLGLIPRLGRSPGEGKGYPLQYSGLENSMDCIVHGVTKSQTQLRDCHFTSKV